MAKSGKGKKDKAKETSKAPTHNLELQKKYEHLIEQGNL